MNTCLMSAYILRLFDVHHCPRVKGVPPGRALGLTVYDFKMWSDKSASAWRETCIPNHLQTRYLGPNKIHYQGSGSTFGIHLMSPNRCSVFQSCALSRIILGAQAQSAVVITISRWTFTRDTTDLKERNGIPPRMNRFVRRITYQTPI